MCIYTAMLKLDYTEFYITNVCNLNCPNCNRCNNYSFSGHTRWQDHVSQNQKWAQLLDLDTVGILGGEPMTNPDFLLWVKGIASLWPHSKIKIITNGTQFARWPQLYDVLLEHNGRIMLEVNCHNLDSKSEISRNIMDFLDDVVDPAHVLVDQRMLNLWNSCYHRIRDDSWPDCATLDDFFDLPIHIQKECHDIHHFSPKIWSREVFTHRIVDRNGIRVELAMADSFNTSTVTYDPVNHGLFLHNSDPVRAMEVCYFKKCHHIIKGKLYKCGPVGILPDFIKQFPVTMSVAQRHLIESYVPAEVDWPTDQLESFVDDLRSAVPVPQCSLCPENMTVTRFKATNKKIQFKRKNPS